LKYLFDSAKHFDVNSIESSLLNQSINFNDNITQEPQYLPMLSSKKEEDDENNYNSNSNNLLLPQFVPITRRRNQNHQRIYKQ
jgi:hypothetical protein